MDLPILAIVVNIMTTRDVTETLDVRGKNCPMPVIETKQAADRLEVGDVLEVLATDPGSVNDLGGWAEATPGVELLDQDDDGDVYRHYVRKVAE